jgi:hypothetical protein
MAAISSALIRMYPREWRRRYGDEMRTLLEADGLSLRTVADLIGGAIDARLNPQLAAANTEESEAGGKKMMKAFCGVPAHTSPAEPWRAARWMIGVTLALTLASLLLQLRVGPNSFSESLWYSAFPAALMMSTPYTYSSRYSASARRIMSLSGGAFIILMMWGATAIAKLI